MKPTGMTSVADNIEPQSIDGPGLLCPCDERAPLELLGEHLICPSCHVQYRRVNGCWDLIRGERFNDEKCECMWCNEENTGRHLVNNYVIPLLRERFSGKDPASLRILSIGCGVGSDVAALNDAGYQAYGIDAGNRSEFWARRSFPNRYYLANAKHLPFESGAFDFIMMGCVLPHIGVGDDTYVAQTGYREERELAACEMIRVTRKDGLMIVTSPNRLCPVDFFHRADVAKHMPRFHSPKESFLLSVVDYSKLLRVGSECSSIEVLPLRGYWGFYSSSNYLLGRLLQIPVRFYFNELMSWRITKWLRSTGFNPWLILLVRR
ncbi:MAG: class I SAM-dependent methyltransferase [Halioglobus sp.]|nr:class I SAM-dependent methyltransferase [Halioglobus sp.]